MAGSITWRAWGVRPGRHYQLIVDGQENDIYVHHCGHPTAIWPYYISRNADGQGSMVLAANGHGFMTLKDAQKAALALWERGRKNDGRG